MKTHPHILHRDSFLTACALFLRRSIAIILLTGILWQQVKIESIVYAVTPEASLLQVEVEVSPANSAASSASSSETSQTGLIPTFSASLISTDETPANEPESSSGSEVSSLSSASSASGSDVIQEHSSLAEQSPSSERTHEAAPQESLTSDILSDTPENTHPAFEVKKQAEIQSADELEQRLTVKLTSPSGTEVEADVHVTEAQGEYVLTLEPPADFKPGKYHIEATLDTNRGVSRALQRLYRIFFQSDEGEQTLFEQDFTWGVLAFNPDHAVYLPGETAHIGMAVLDDGGRTLCDAQVSLTVTDSTGSQRVLSTENGTMTANPDCKDKAVTYIPDYSADVLLDSVGTYTFEMKAVTRNGIRTMSQQIVVKDTRLIDVYRSSATRIYPLADYEMKISVTPSHSFIGSVTETVPDSFVITRTNPTASTVSSNEETGLTTITWGDRLWEAGTVYDLRYDYDPPDVSPQFYLTGPLKAQGTIMRPYDAPVPAEEQTVSLLEEQAMTGAGLHGSADEEDSGVSPFFDDVQPSGSVVPGFEDVTASASSGSEIAPSSAFSASGAFISSASGSVQASSQSGVTVSSSSASSIASESGAIESFSSFSTSGTALSSSSSDTTSTSSVSSSQTSSSVSPDSSASSPPDESPPEPELSPEASPSAWNTFSSWLLSFIFEHSYADIGDDTLTYEEPRQWQIAADSISNITGKVTTKEGVRLAGKSVAVSLSGSIVAGTATTDAGGQFTITGVNLSDGGVITLYLDGESEKAVTVSLGSGTTMTGMNLIQNALIIRNDSHSISAVTDSHLKVAITNGDTDITSIVSSATDSSARVTSGKSMIIATGTTFRPAGEVRVGSGITINGTFDMEANPVALSGSWITQGAGIFTGTNTVTFNGVQGDITSNTSTFYSMSVQHQHTAFDANPLVNIEQYKTTDALRLSGSLLLGPGNWQFQVPNLPVRIHGDMIAQNQTISLGNGLWTVSGDWIYKGTTGTMNSQLVMLGNNKYFQQNAPVSHLILKGNTTLSGSSPMSDGELTIGTGVTVLAPVGGHDGMSVYRSDIRIHNNAVFSGGSLYLASGANILVQRGIFRPAYMQILADDSTNVRLVPAKYDALWVDIVENVAASKTIRFGTGTTAFRGNVYLYGTTAGSVLQMDSQTYNSLLAFEGNLANSSFGSGSITWMSGTNPVVFSGANLQTLSPVGSSFKNIAVNKTAQSLTITSAGTGENITLSGGTLAINDDTSFRVTKTLLVNASTTLSLNTGATLLMVGDNADVKVRANGTIMGSGALNVGSGASISTMSGTIRSYSLTIGGNHTGAGNRIVATKYNAVGTVIYTTDATTNFEFSPGTTTFNGSLYFNSTGGTLSVKNSITNPNLIVKGTMTTCSAYPACRGKIDWQKGTGVLTFTGGFIHTLQMSGASLEAITIAKTNGYLTLVGTGSTTSMTVSRGEFRQSPGSLWDINGALTINRTSPTVFGQYSISGGTLALSGNLINTNGVFRATTGSVILDGGNQTLSGSNTFYTLQKTVTSQKTLTLAAGKVQNISGSLILRGASGNLLNIRSAVTGQQAMFNLETGGGQQVIDHLNVQDNRASGKRLDCFIGNSYGEGCINSGHNTNWNFGEITGTSRYQGEGTSIGNQTIRYSINGGPVVDTFPVGNTDFQFTVSGATLTGGSIITLTNNYGMTVSLGSGSTMTGFDVYYGRLSIRNDYNSGAITTDDLAIADNGIPFDCVGMGSPVPVYQITSGKLSIHNNCGSTDAHLRIESGATFRPGGDVGINGDVTINGTFNMEDSPVSLSGSWLTNGNGAFTGTNFVWFDAESSDVFVRSRASSFYDLKLGTPTSSPLKGITLLDNLSLSGSLLTGSGGFMLDDAGYRVRINGNVSLNNNYIVMGSGGVWIVSGDWTDTDTTTFITAGVTLSGSSFIVLDGDENSILHNAAFANLTVSGSIHMLTGAFITQTLTIATGATLSLDTTDIHQGMTIYSEGSFDADLRLLGTDSLVTGPGILHIISGSSVSLNRGIIAPQIFHVAGQHIGAGNRIAPGRYYSLISSLEPGLPSTDTTIEFNPGVYTFSGSVGFGGDSDVYAVKSDPSTQFVFLGGLYLTDPSTLVFNQGAYPIIFSGSTNSELLLSGRSLDHILLSKPNSSLLLVSSGSLRNMEVDQGTFDQNGQALSITGTLVLSGGTFYVHGGTLTLSGDLMGVGGSLTDSTGSVILNGASQKLYGTNTFYNLTKIASESGQYLVMGANETQTVNGLLTLQGSASGDVLMIVAASSSYFNLTSAGSQIVDHVAVMNNIASGQQIVCYTATEGCIDNGNNVNWLFAPVTSSSSSASSASSQGPGGGRRDDTIQEQIEEITGTSANLLLSYPPDPPPGCEVKLMEAKLNDALFFLGFDGTIRSQFRGSALPITIDTAPTPGYYISGFYYAGIQQHRSSIRAIDTNGNIRGYYSFDYQHDGDNYARLISYNGESVRSLRWTQGSTFETTHYLAAYQCPLSLHGAPGDTPPNQTGSGDYTLPDFPIIDPALGNTTQPIQPILPGLNQDDFIIDEQGNIISYDGKFLIDGSGNLLNYEDLLRSVTGSLLLQQMRMLHFASLLQQGGLTQFYKPLTAEQLALLQKLLKHPLVSILGSDFLPNTILQPLIEDYMRDPTDDHWNAITNALTEDVSSKGAATPTSVSILSDAIRRSIQEFIGFTRTALWQLVTYPLRLAGYFTNQQETDGSSLPSTYETLLRPQGGSNELAVFHLRIRSAYGEPLARTPVILFSVPKFTTTDNDGVATFFDVPVGVHRLEVHLDDGRTETRMVTIRPPTNIRLTAPVATELPLADVVIPEGNSMRTDPDIFPPLFYLMVAILIGGAIYTRKRRKQQRSGDDSSEETGSKQPSPETTPSEPVPL